MVNPAALLGVVIGLAALTWAAEQFVAGAVRVANRLNVSLLVIGAVVVGFGTSAPEMVVSGLAASQGEIDIAIGNIIGSNVANLSLVLGTAALIIPIIVASSNIRREAPLSLGGTVLFAILIQNGLTQTEGIVLAVALLVILTRIILASRGDDEELSEEVAEYIGEDEVPLLREVGRTILGLTVTVASAQVLVMSAVAIANDLGLADGFVGLTIVAIGTSLPELATSLQAARRAETDLIVGNLLGSNLFNSLGVGAVAAFAGAGETIDPSLTGLAVGLMLMISVLATVAMATGRRVVAFEGALLLGAWLVTLPLMA